MQTLLRAVIVGDTLVVPGGRYDPAEVLELIERHKINRWTAVPTMVSRLLDHPDVARRDAEQPQVHQHRRRAGACGADAAHAHGVAQRQSAGADRLRPDRERRPGHRIGRLGEGRAAGLDRQADAAGRSQVSRPSRPARRRDPAALADADVAATTASTSRRSTRKAGCTPATSAGWTRRATCGSPGAART